MVLALNIDTSEISLGFDLNIEVSDAYFFVSDRKE
jgi:hypothetical protein